MAINLAIFRTETGRGGGEAGGDGGRKGGGAAIIEKTAEVRDGGKKIGGAAIVDKTAETRVLVAETRGNDAGSGGLGNFFHILHLSVVL